MERSLESEIAAVLEAHDDVVGGYLFGSVDRGDAHADSDIDIAVLFDGEPSLDRIVALEDRLETALGRAVDLVDLGRADAFLALDAIRGERVFERDGLPLDEFDLYVMRRAGDLAYHERRRRRMRLAPG